MLGFEYVDSGCVIDQKNATPYHVPTSSDNVQPRNWKGLGRKMLEPKYMGEEDLFNALGDFALDMITEFNKDGTDADKAKWLADSVEGLTAKLWEELPLRRGRITPSTN